MGIVAVGLAVGDKSIVEHKGLGFDGKVGGVTVRYLWSDADRVSVGNRTIRARLYTGVVMVKVALFTHSAQII